METQNFAQQLTAARKAAKMTQEQLAERMHMSRQGISHWETGRSLPDAETLKRLSQMLNYDFVTSQTLEAEPDIPAELSDPAEEVRAAPEKTAGQRPVALLSAVVAVIGVAVVVLLCVLLGGQGETSAPASGMMAPVVTFAPADRAAVQVVPAQNPLVPSYDPVLGPDPWWIFRFAIQETAGVDFTVGKMTYTFVYRNGERHVAEYSGDFVASSNTLGTNIVRYGQPINISSAEPLRDFVTITVRVDGTDAKGNELSAECVFECQMPEPTATPFIDPSAKGVMSVQANVDALRPQVLEDLGPDPVWFMWFDIFESAGVPITLTKIVFTAEHAEGVAWQDAFDGQMIADIYGTNVIAGGSALPWTVCNNLAPLTGFTLQVEAVDANGNVLTGQDSVILLQE